MQDSSMITESDMALINCLELHPRMTWQHVASTIGLDPVTVARRWSRLRDAGQAWVTGRPSRYGMPESCTAIIQVHCTAALLTSVAAALCQWPDVFSVEHVGGGYDLQLYVMMPNLAALAEFTTSRISTLPGVTGARSQVITGVLAVGETWRLGVLDPRQRAEARQAYALGPPGGGKQGLDDLDRTLVVTLGADGRKSFADLARYAGASINTVRRRLNRLQANGDLLLRCDVANAASGWPIALWVWGRIDPADQQTPGLLIQQEGVRVCLRLTGGEANVLLGVAGRSMQDLPDVWSRLRRNAPGFHAIHDALVLRFHKRMGQLLDADGRKVGHVPMDIWSAPAL